MQSKLADAEAERKVINKYLSLIMPKLNTL